MGKTVFPSSTIHRLLLPSSKSNPVHTKSFQFQIRHRTEKFNRELQRKIMACFTAAIVLVFVAAAYKGITGFHQPPTNFELNLIAVLRPFVNVIIPGLLFIAVVAWLQHQFLPLIQYLLITSSQYLILLICPMLAPLVLFLILLVLTFATTYGLFALL